MQYADASVAQDREVVKLATPRKSHRKSLDGTEGAAAPADDFQKRKSTIFLDLQSNLAAFSKVGNFCKKLRRVYFVDIEIC